MKWEGVTPAQYEKVRELTNWEGNIPKGAVFHVAGFYDNTLRVTDIWESAEDFNNFVQNRLMPSVAQVGITGQPEVKLFPVHAIFAPALVNLKNS
jgi:hypothetical protein